jgi:TnpA family transposase
MDRLHAPFHAPEERRSGRGAVLLTAILADGINLGLSKMAESCPGTTYAKLSWLQAWHIREETYRAALAEVVNAQARHPFAAWWGDGTTSSSDGQRFRAGGRGEAAGQVNARYGNDVGVLFYTHVSDQYAPFQTQVIHATVRDATYVLDGLLYHEADLKIEEHYTDTAGFTDHVFALMHLLGFRFAPASASWRTNGSTSRARRSATRRSRR